MEGLVFELSIMVVRGPAFMIVGASYVVAPVKWSEVSGLPRKNIHASHARQPLRIDWAKQPDEMWWKSRSFAVKANWDVQQRQSFQRTHTWVGHAQLYWLASGRENPHQCHAICHNMTPIALWMTSVACQERHHTTSSTMLSNWSKCIEMLPYSAMSFSASSASN